MTVSTFPAADLPEGSVIANEKIALFRMLPGLGAVWRGTDGRRYDDAAVDKMLADRAVVLRAGLGETR